MQNCFFLLEPNFVIINTRLTGGMTYIIRLKQQQDGRALKWASQEMKDDRELCMAAVAQFRRDGISDVATKSWLNGFGVPAAVLRDALTK